MNIPSVTTPTQTEKKGANKADYEKFVVVDTNGVLVDKGQVAYAMDLIKDENIQNRANFLEELFGAVGMDFKVRETQAREVKSASASDLLKKFAKGN